MSLFGSFASDDTVDLVTDSSSWTSFTPAFTSGIGSVGDSTYQARYKLLGEKTIAVAVRYLIGSGATLDSTPGAYVLMTSPVSAGYSFGTGLYHVVGTGIFQYTSTPLSVIGGVRLNPDGKLNFVVPTSYTNVALTNLDGANCVAGSSQMNFMAVYELA